MWKDGKVLEVGKVVLTSFSGKAVADSHIVSYSRWSQLPLLAQDCAQHSPLILRRAITSPVSQARKLRPGETSGFTQDHSALGMGAGFELEPFLATRPDMPAHITHRFRLATSHTSVHENASRCPCTQHLLLSRDTHKCTHGLFFSLSHIWIFLFLFVSTQPWECHEM